MLADTTPIIAKLLDDIKHQLESDFIDNPIKLCDEHIVPTTLSSAVTHFITRPPRTASTLILTLFDTYLTSEFLDCEQAHDLFICSKHVPTHFILTRLLTHINASNGIYETRRAVFFIFGFILFQRRSSTRILLQEVIPYLINMKSNEFMLEPNVYSMSLLLNILLVVELNTSNDRLEDLFQIKSWRQAYQHIESMMIDIQEDNFVDIVSRYDDSSVVDAYHDFFDYASRELFSSDNVRPVNYFLGWFQTILWMFSRTTKSLKQFIKPKLVAQLSEYLPLQFPIEKVLSILDLSNDLELEYASMAITHDYGRLQAFHLYKPMSFIPNQSTEYEENIRTRLVTTTRNIFTIPKSL